MNTIAVILLALMLLVISLCLYFLPTIVAHKRNHRNLLGIFLLNLFLGWMLIGWVGALVWAVLVSQSDSNGGGPSSLFAQRSEEPQNSWTADADQKIARYAEQYHQQNLQRRNVPPTPAAFGRRNI
jgi:ABC-type sugar transport system permease subunit